MQGFISELQKSLPGSSGCVTALNLVHSSMKMLWMEI
jgi:hypothetical protein